MASLTDLLLLYADYRSADPFARKLREHFPVSYLIRVAVSRRLQGVKWLLGV